MSQYYPQRGVEGVVPSKLKVCALINTPPTVEDDTTFWDWRASSEGKGKFYTSH